MKKIKSLFFAVAMVLVATTFVSCELDEWLAYELEGIWEGEVATEYFSNRYGKKVEYQYVQIEFDKDPRYYAAGDGEECDYDRNGRYVRCRFQYKVRNNVIYINYADRTHVAIYNYRLNHGYFEGQFCDYRSTSRPIVLADFRFQKVSRWRY